MGQRAPHRPRRILMAEDEPFIVESVSFLLRREGFEARATGDGLSVFPLIEQWQPDLLLLDVMLPELNGFDVLRQIRATPSTAALPVLVLTAKGQAADRLRVTELGADGFVTKPFSNTDLMDQIKCLLSGASMQDGLAADRQTAAPS